MKFNDCDGCMNLSGDGKFCKLADTPISNVEECSCYKEGEDTNGNR